MQQIGVVPFLVLLVVSLAGSLVASLLYVQFYSSRATGSQVYRAFPLLGLSITAIFVCIQFSLPLSLGLLGALSIVRFRTPIKEPEEIGFIMLVIAASIATATFKLAFVGLLFAFALVALLVQTGGRAWARYRRDGTLVVTLPGSSGGHEPERDHRRGPAPRRQRQAREPVASGRDAGAVVRLSQSRSRGDRPAAGGAASDADGLTFHLFLSRPGTV